MLVGREFLRLLFLLAGFSWFYQFDVAGLDGLSMRMKSIPLIFGISLIQQRPINPTIAVKLFIFSIGSHRRSDLIGHIRRFKPITV